MDYKSVCVSVIGTSGRKGEIVGFGRFHYEWMIKECKKRLKKIAKLEKCAVRDLTLVSGGSALSDHVAVDLFLESYVHSLILYVPCDWDCKNCKFMDTGGRDWRSNPGGTLNFYHRAFSQRLTKESLLDISSALELGAELRVIPGFFPRNKAISKSKYMIAFGKSKTGAPTSSGTKYTWSMAPPETIKYYIAV